jgi:uncharacterized protein YfaS (alpha-2-macroglobulin family)
MKRSKYFIALLSIVLLLSCQLPPIIGTPTPTAAPLSPQVIQVTPERGEEQQLTAPIQVVFDQPMDRDSVEAAFAVEPAVAGTFEWPTERVVQFKPAGEGFARATRYTLTIKQDALSADKVPLREPVLLHFTTVGFLEVATAQPAPDTGEVALDATVTVMFNRPVVALSAIESRGGVTPPLAFTPPVAGAGEWLNTSIYVFTPAEGFLPATTYEARIAAGLADTTGGVLADDYTWQFTTVMPAVAAVYPGDATIYVDPQPTIYVAFNQPMDHASVEAAFTLKDAETDEVIPGHFEWHNQGLVLTGETGGGAYYEPYQWSWRVGEGPERVGMETMGFTPNQPLDFDTTYQAEVAEGARGAGGGQAGTRGTYRWAFTTIAYPRIVSTNPADGEQRADPWTTLEVVFSSPMDPDSINDNFTISPPVSATEVYTYWWDSDTHLGLSFPIEASSDYTVTIGGNMRGRYGHPLDEDTTIHWRTRAYDPQVYLNTPGVVATYNAYTNTATYVTVLNVGRVNLALYRMPLEDFIRANGPDGWSYWDAYRGQSENLVRQWTLDANPPLDESRVYRVNLPEDGGALAPGLYFLTAQGDYDSIYPEARPTDVQLWLNKQMLVVSRYNLSLKATTTEEGEALAWATDLRSGDGAAGLPVQIMVSRPRGSAVLAEGTTDGDGVFFAEIHKPLEDQQSPVFAFAGDPENPDEDFAAGVSEWNSGISPWDFGLSVEYYQTPFVAYIFTDRPIYRPGQTIYFKGILRQDDDAHYSVQDTHFAADAERTVSVAIWDAQGTQVLSQSLPVSEDMATFNGEFSLGEEAALGNYSVQVDYKGIPFYTTFQVAEYRKPEFEVTVETERAEYVQGDEIAVTAQATYFFGGPVANASVRYAVLSADYFFNYQGQGWWDFTDYDYWDYWRGGGSSYGEVIAEGSGTTDAQGRFTFSVEADIADKINSQRFTLEVTVTDVNNQEVSNRVEALVHKGLFYIGLQPEQYVSTVGDEARVNLITVDWESEPSPNRELTVVFAQRNWYSVQKQAEDGSYYWESTVEDTPVYTVTVTTDSQGKATAAFVPEQGGTYRVIASGLDERENKVQSATYLWVSGHEYVNWRQENNDRIELVADQRTYRVGETATILIPHPYQGPVQALITVERGHIYRHWVQTLETNSEQIQIPITADLIPNVFVSVVVVKGMDETTPLPDFKVGYVELPIEMTEKELTITMTPDRAADVGADGAAHYAPGDTVNYDVQVADSAGNPVEAELALALVDKAVLTLAAEPGPGIVDYFWRERGLGVWTANGLTLSGERANEQTARETKGLGGGGGGEEFGPVRSRFPDLAYWNPTLRTDRSGHASVSVQLPDNLTTWRMGARGVTAETLVGQANVDIVSTKDLLVRPVAPRFFVVGDEASLSAVIHNNTSEPLDVEVAFEAEGLQIAESARQRVSIPANDNVKVTWQVTVTDVPTATLLFGARGGGLADAVEIALPVYRYSTPEVVATAGTLDADGQRVEAASLPLSYDPTQGELTVQIDPSLAAGMVDGLDYLEHYPYECTEQTVSRFLPNVVTYRAFKDLGIDVGAQRAEPLVNEGLQRLYNQQHYDGGWGWWVLGQSDPYLSAYVLLGMVEAQRAGFTVDDGVMERAARYLRNSLSRRRDVQEHWLANRQAFILYVLAEAGAGDLGRTVALFEQRDVLDTFGKAYLALALALLEPEEPAHVNTLLSDINGAAIVSATGAHWEEAQPDYYAMNTDTRSTAIVLVALARLDPGNALAPNAVRWLMAVRREGTWETTQETAWSIIALTDWMVATGELQGNYDWQVVVNGELLGEGSVTRENVGETTRLQIEVAQLLAEAGEYTGVNRVIVERWAPEGQEAGTGMLYYGLYLRYFKPVEEVTALNRGVIVGRQYTRADCEEERCPTINSAQVGDVIRVKLTIIAPNDLHYVVIEDPFPAGTEGVDQSLLTTSVVGERPESVRTDRYDPWGGYGWWWFSHSELRDEKAVLFADYLPAGTYEYTYLIRASLPGEFRVIPTLAYEMYFPEVFGRSDGGLFTIGE